MWPIGLTRPPLGQGCISIEMVPKVALPPPRTKPPLANDGNVGGLYVFDSQSDLGGRFAGTRAPRCSWYQIIAQLGCSWYMCTWLNRSSVPACAFSISEPSGPRR